MTRMDELLIARRKLLDALEIVTRLIQEEERGTTEGDRKSEKVKNLLNDLGIKCKWDGYNYLYDAILLCLDDKDYLREGLSNKLYPELSKKYQKKSGSIRTRIDYAINQAFLRQTKKQKIFKGAIKDPKNPRVTVAVFLNVVVDYLS